jgi:hypothetical protein
MNAHGEKATVQAYRVWRRLTHLAKPHDAFASSVEMRLTRRMDLLEKDNADRETARAFRKPF